MAEADKIIFPLIKEVSHMATRSGTAFSATVYPDDGYKIISIFPKFCTATKVGGGSEKIYPSITKISPTEYNMFISKARGYTVFLSVSTSTPATSLSAIITYQAKI